MTDVSGVGRGIQPQPQAQVEGGRGAEAGRGADSDKGIIAKGLGFLSKVWAHLTGNAGTVHDQQMASLRDHVTVKFGPEGLLRLNATLQKQGWAGDSKVFSSSELASTLKEVGTGETRLEAITEQLREQPLSEQLKNPTLKEASYTLAAVKLATGQVEFLEAMNHLEANRGTMSTADFNARVAELVTKHIDERGQSFSVGGELDPTAVDHNINVSSKETKAVCELLDKYKAAVAAGKPEDANKAAQDMFALMKGQIKDDVNVVWVMDNGQRGSASGMKAPLATYNQAFTTAATELLPGDAQYQVSLRADRAAQFIRG